MYCKSDKLCDLRTDGSTQQAGFANRNTKETHTYLSIDNYVSISLSFFRGANKFGEYQITQNAICFAEGLNIVSATF